jgi:TonB family protein
MEQREIWRFLAIALLVHMALAPLVERFLPAVRERPAKRLQLVTLRGSGTRAGTAAPPPPARPEDKPEAKVKQDGQVVELPPSADDRAPDDAAYLSEHNTRTLRETRSRFTTPDYKNVMNELSVQKRSPDRQTATQLAQAAEVGPREGSPDSAAGGGLATAFELPTLQQRDGLHLSIDEAIGLFRNQDPSDALAGNSQRLNIQTGEGLERGGGAPNAGTKQLELVPDVGVLAELSGAPANDYLQDVEEGDGTFLNSREFKFASYFNRVSRGVRRHWRPGYEYRRRDPTGNIYGQQSRVTVLHIVLDREGNLAGINVESSSGVEFLDSEAVTAFQRAGPFPNPPRGLIDTDTGVIAFRFGFHLVPTGRIW